MKTEVFPKMGNRIKNFSTDALVEIFCVDNTRLRVRGIVTLEIRVFDKLNNNS
jgi:hypothetical protein